MRIILSLLILAISTSSHIVSADDHTAYYENEILTIPVLMVDGVFSTTFYQVELYLIDTQPVIFEVISANELDSQVTEGVASFSNNVLQILEARVDVAILHLEFNLNS